MICDDSLSDLDHAETLLRSYSAQHPERVMEVTVFNHPDAFLSIFERDPQVHLVLMDMVMPFVSGIEVAKAIRLRNPEVQILCTSASKDFAVDSYTVNAANYLLKPLRQEALFPILDQLWATLNQPDQPCLILRERETISTIALFRIAYVEVMGHHLLIHLRNKAVVHLNGSLKEQLPLFKKDPRFIQPHKSYLVNLDAVSCIQNADFVMQDHHHVPIARSLAKSVKARYLDHLMAKGKRA